jgi:hypothetical protein
MITHSVSWFYLENTYFCFDIFAVLGFELRALHLPGKHSAIFSVLFCFGYYWDSFLRFCPVLALDCNLPTSASYHVVVITHTYHHAWFICWCGVLLTFLPGMAWNHHPPDLYLPSKLRLQVLTTKPGPKLFLLRKSFMKVLSLTQQFTV